MCALFGRYLDGSLVADGFVVPSAGDGSALSVLTTSRVLAAVVAAALAEVAAVAAAGDGLRKAAVAAKRKAVPAMCRLAESPATGEPRRAASLASLASEEPRRAATAIPAGWDPQVPATTDPVACQRSRPSASPGERQMAARARPAAGSVQGVSHAVIWSAGMEPLNTAVSSRSSAIRSLQRESRVRITKSNVTTAIWTMVTAARASA